MGLLDSVIGALGQAQQGGGAGQGHGDLLGAVIGMLGQGGGGAGGGLGGLAGLVEKLTQAGHGDTVNSWVGTGQNLPISPGALGGVLGNDTIAGLARQLGINPEDALGQLSQMLPQVVDKLTPNGALPPAGDTGSAATGSMGDLSSLLGGLMNQR